MESEGSLKADNLSRKYFIKTDNDRLDLQSTLKIKCHYMCQETLLFTIICGAE